jgi:hypothetical protein
MLFRKMTNPGYNPRFIILMIDWFYLQCSIVDEDCTVNTRDLKIAMKSPPGSPVEHAENMP